MVAKIEGLSDEQMTGVLRKVYGSGPEAERKIADALTALNVRKQHLRAIMQKHFPPLPNAVTGSIRAPAAPRPATGNVAPAPVKTKPKPKPVAWRPLPVPPLRQAA